MERGNGGYMRIVVGMPDSASRLPSSARRRLKEDERRSLVFRLRRQGWSYRRISDELNISYATVSRWLDGPEVTETVDLPVPQLTVRSDAPLAVPIRQPVFTVEIQPRAEVVSPAIDYLLMQNQALIQQVEHLVAADAARRQAMAEMEQRLVANIEEQNKKLGDRLLDTIKAALRKFLPG